MIKRSHLPDWVKTLVFLPIKEQGRIIGTRVMYYNHTVSEEKLREMHRSALMVVSKEDFLNELFKEKTPVVQPQVVAESDTPPSKYHIRNPGGKWLDFYDIWDALMARRKHLIGDSALAHAFKKMFAPGERDGGKDRLHDAKDMQWSVNRAVEQIEKDLNKRIDEHV